MDKVLFVGWGALGDMIFMLPALKALREGLPKARLVLATDDNLGGRELLPAMNLVDEIWRWPRVGEEPFDAAVVSLAAPVRRYWKTLRRAPLRVGQLWPYSFFSKRAFFAGQWERKLLFNRPLRVFEEDRHMAQRHLDLVAALGVPVPQAAAARPQLPRTPEAEAFAAEALKPGSGALTIGLHLGPPDNHYRKMWPPERWAEVARGLQSQRPCRFVVLGGPDERPAVEAFRRTFMAPYVDLAGTAPLPHSIAAIRRCDLLLSSDTGLSKVAMACGVATATVWGPTSRRDNGALWDPQRHLEITHAAPCEPSVALGLRRWPARHDCLAAISSEDALRQLRPVVEGLSA